VSVPPKIPLFYQFIDEQVIELAHFICYNAKKFLRFGTRGKDMDIGKMPDFLRKEYKSEETELSKLIAEYDEKIGDGFCSWCVPISNEEFAEILRECIKTGRTFCDVYGISSEPEPDEYW